MLPNISVFPRHVLFLVRPGGHSLETNTQTDKYISGYKIAVTCELRFKIFIHGLTVLITYIRAHFGLREQNEMIPGLLCTGCK